MKIHTLTPYFTHYKRPPEILKPNLVVLSHYDGTFLSRVDACRSNKTGYHVIIAENSNIYLCVPYEFRVKSIGSSYGPREHGRFINTKHRLGDFVAETSVDNYAINVCICGKPEFVDFISTLEVERFTTACEVNPYRFKEFPHRDEIYALEKKIPYWVFPKSCLRESL